MADVYKQSFKQNYTNNIELSIFNCGLERCAPGQTWGPGIRDHYLIHLVVSGKGVCEVGGRTYEVVPGDLIFARPSRPPHPGPGGNAGGSEQHLLFPRPAAPGRGRDGGLSLPVHRRPDAGDQ